MKTFAAARIRGAKLLKIYHPTKKNLRFLFFFHTLLIIKHLRCGVLYLSFGICDKGYIICPWASAKGLHHLSLDVCKRATSLVLGHLRQGFEQL